RGSNASQRPSVRQRRPAVTCVAAGNGSALADYEVSKKQMLLTEINLIIQLRHCNIVRCYNYIIDREAKRAYIIMEYCPNGDLAALIKQHSERQMTSFAGFHSSLWLYAAATVAKVFKAMPVEASNLRRLRPRQRVLAGDASFASTYLGTPYYMSPEQVKLCGYTEKSDMWALGVVAYELASAGQPSLRRWADEQRRLADSLGTASAALLKVARERELTLALAAQLTSARGSAGQARGRGSQARQENNFSLGVASCADSTRLLQLPHLSQHPMPASASASPVAPVHDEGRFVTRCGCVDEKEERPPQLHRPVPPPRRNLAEGSQLVTGP
uniref:non-specific serine/threonine protein kinase n=1 Tax=Macrostomum lignano TaxID=282301 RepID=A0A1I8FCI1_9PLAT